MFTLKIDSPNKDMTDYKNDVEKWQLFLRSLRYDVALVPKLQLGNFQQEAPAS